MRTIEEDTSESPIGMPGNEPHGRWEDLMITALDGRCAGEQQQELEGHLAACPGCRRTFEEYVRVYSGLRAATAEDLPGDFWDSLSAGLEPPLAETEDRAPARARSEGEWHGVYAGVAAAGIVGLVLVGLYLALPRPAGAPQAFTTPPADGQLARAGEGAAPAEYPVSGLESSARALDSAAGARDPLAQDWLARDPLARDPLADLAGAEQFLQELTPGEAGELIRELEARI